MSEEFNSAVRAFTDNLKAHQEAQAALDGQGAEINWEDVARDDAAAKGHNPDEFVRAVAEALSPPEGNQSDEG